VNVNTRSLNIALSKSMEEVTERLNTTHVEVYATRKDVVATFEIVKTIQNEADEERRKDMIRNVKAWLTYTDPATSHQAASKKCQPGTGQWLVNGVRFREWKRSRGSFMWLNGIRKLFDPDMQFPCF
jgi:hypothetical protein